MIVTRRLFFLVSFFVASFCLRRITLGTEHKTGTHLAEGWKTIWERNCHFHVDINRHFHKPISNHPNEKYVLIIRDIFSMIASGYRYHLAKHENQLFEPRLKFLMDVINEAKRFDLPVPDRTIRYGDYLNSLSEHDGFLAQMIRSEHRDAPNVAYMATLRNQSNVMVICLEDVDRNNTEAFKKVANFVGCKGDRIITKMHEKMHTDKINHATDRTNATRQIEIIRNLDYLYFDSYFNRTNANVNCNC